MLGKSVRPGHFVVLSNGLGQASVTDGRREKLSVWHYTGPLPPTAAQVGPSFRSKHSGGSPELRCGLQYHPGNRNNERDANEVSNHISGGVHRRLSVIKLTSVYSLAPSFDWLEVGGYKSARRWMNRVI